MFRRAAWRCCGMRTPAIDGEMGDFSGSWRHSVCIEYSRLTSVLLDRRILRATSARRRRRRWERRAKLNHWSLHGTHRHHPSLRSQLICRPANTSTRQLDNNCACATSYGSLDPLITTLKPQSNGPSYSSTVHCYTSRWWVDCYIWYSEEGTGRGRSPPRPLL